MNIISYFTDSDKITATTGSLSFQATAGDSCGTFYLMLQSVYPSVCVCLCVCVCVCL